MMMDQRSRGFGWLVMEVHGGGEVHLGDWGSHVTGGWGVCGGGSRRDETESRDCH